jgi:hypothetical protein
VADPALPVTSRAPIAILWSDSSELDFRSERLRDGAKDAVAGSPTLCFSRPLVSVRVGPGYGVNPSPNGPAMPDPSPWLTPGGGDSHHSGLRAGVGSWRRDANHCNVMASVACGVPNRRHHLLPESADGHAHRCLVTASRLSSWL